MLVECKNRLVGVCGAAVFVGWYNGPGISEDSWVARCLAWSIKNLNFLFLCNKVNAVEKNAFRRYGIQHCDTLSKTHLWKCDLLDRGNNLTEKHLPQLCTNLIFLFYLIRKIKTEFLPRSISSNILQLQHFSYYNSSFIKLYFCNPHCTSVNNIQP